MNVFEIHKQVIGDYAQYIHSFINISDPEIKRKVDESLSEHRLWPQPLLQFNPAYEKVGTIDQVVDSGLLHEDSRHIFEGFSLYRHQRQAIELGVNGTDFIVTSGTGSGKSLTYISTIFNHLLANQGTDGVVAVIVYPMNALINSQTNEFSTYKGNYERLKRHDFPIIFSQYTGQEKEEQRRTMREKPPQILLTNYMMLELLLTRIQERPIRDAIFQNLRYLIFDELHTYRGRQGADISLLIRRILSQCQQPVCCVGTSATMVSASNPESQLSEVAQVARTVFGRPFETHQVINETLARSLDVETIPTKQELHAAISAGIDTAGDEADLRKHPVAVWLENRIALEEQDGQLVRRQPMRLGDVVAALAEDSGASEDKCQTILETTLQWVSNVNQCIQQNNSRYTLLPFKLHQFIAQTGSVYTTLDQGEERFITLEPGIYKHDDSKKPIFPNVFSRATGHPFICVSLLDNRLEPREFRTAQDDNDATTDGYLIIGDDIWDPDQDFDYLPSAWVRNRTNGKKVPVKERQARFPRKLYFDEYGNCSETEPMKYWGWFMQEPLLFDPTGGVFFDAKTNEGTKLTRLGNEGRSTSTTITAFSILNRLRDNGHSLQDQKILSFTDNRQDAALQAGHFNDFVQVVRLRAGIRKALEIAPHGILDFSTLGQAIFKSLSLPFRDYGNREGEPELARVKRKYEDVLQEYLLFRAFADLRRSWRIVLPNLEQCALLEIDYLDLEEVVSDDGFWTNLEIVNGLTHKKRREFLITILDHFRLEYAVYSENYLEPNRIRESERRFRELLKAPWTLDADEELLAPSVMRLDPLHKGVRLSNKSMGPTSSLGKYVKYVAKEAGTEFADSSHYSNFMLELMHKLTEADYLYKESARNTNDEEVPVYRLRINNILWKLGDGETVRPDPIKRRSYKDHKPTPNQFFQDLYKRDFSDSKRLLAADHTGQLGVDARQDREERFRADWHLDDARTVLDDNKIRSESLSALFCSTDQWSWAWTSAA